MSRKISLVFGALIFIGAQFSFGSAMPPDMRDYLCTIQRVASALYAAGDLHELDKKVYVGKKFTISRLTGSMSGALRSPLVVAPIVVDYGSSENSFKVVTAMNQQQSIGPGTLLETLTVSEYIESAQKPFVVASGESVYFGICEHF